MPEIKPTAFRISPGDLAEIDRRARSFGLTRSEYVRRAALGLLPSDLDATQKRFEAIEKRLDRLESQRESAGS